jgi:filamentous hemagglutinin family protein
MQALGGWLCLTVLIAGAIPATAQVVLDGKFGNSGPLSGPDYGITAEVGLTRGNNLFHSFSRFDLKVGDTASFSGPASIQNILSRVTGGRASTIDGMIRSEIAGANLFLINPEGIVFGPNSAIDVSGSFAASGANYLKLADDARFVAALDADDSRLSTAPVAAFGFLNRAGGTVEVQGALKAAANTSLSLVGTSVSVTDGARLEAMNGRILVRGVGLGGEIPVSESGPIGNPGGNGGDADLVSGGIVIRGGQLVVHNAIVAANSTGGDIDIALAESLDLVEGGQILSSSTATLKGGDIVIDSPSVRLDGRDGSSPTRIASETFSNRAEAGGGDIRINANLVELRKGAELSVSSFGAADAGRLEVTAQTLRLQGSDQPQFPTQISANASPTIGAVSGAAGEIVIRANEMEIANFAGILAATTGDAAAGAVDIVANTLRLANGAITTFTAGAGAGGEVRIRAQELTLDGPFASITALTTGLDGSLPAGNGGVIRVEADQLQLLNDSGISADTLGDGRGGNIDITAKEIRLDTATFQPGSIPGIRAASQPPFFGDSEGGEGGDISIAADMLTLRGGMTISTTTATAGDGGNINVSAGMLTLDSESSIQSASIGVGRAGTLALRSTGDVLLNSRSSLSTSAPLSSGGDILVEARHEIQLFNSGITAQAGPGGGGSITLMAPSLIYLLDSTLTAQAIGDGGNLTLDPDFLILNRSGLISKSSSANGGNITVLSDYFFQSSSFIDASAPFGLPGTVSVSAPEVDLSGSLVGLPGSMLDVESQLRPDCAVRLTGGMSSFVVLGRGGLPLQPGGFLPSGALRTGDETK